MPRLIYPFQPHVIDSLPNELTALYRDLESQLLEGICARIHAAGEMNEVTLQNIRALRANGLDIQEIEQAIQQTAGLSAQNMNQLFQDVISRNQGYFSSLINMAGLTEPETLVDASTLNAIQRQAQNGVLNLTRSMGFLVNNGQTMLKPAQAYQWALDQALLKVQSGAWNYNSAIWDAVRQLADSGLKAVDYESGFVSALDVAVRRAIMTGVNQINQKYRDQSAEFLQTDLVEVTAHLGARNIKGPKGWEAHSEWQGKVYQKGKTGTGGKYPSFEKKCGYGDVQGIGGANCRHSYWPFVEGVSERTYTDSELEGMKPENRPKIQYDGKEYDDYQATQIQRRLESTYRKAKRREIAAKAIGNDHQAAAARARRIALSRKYADFSAAANLPEQRDRMKVYWPQGQQSQGSSGAGTTPKPAPVAPIAPTGTGSPKNLYRSVKQGLQSGGVGGTIKPVNYSSQILFQTPYDPMLEAMGPAEISHPKEIEAIKEKLKEMGIELRYKKNEDLGYSPGIFPGQPGQMLISEGASYSAWKHEYKHAIDDYNDGFLGMRVSEDKQKCAKREIDAYQVEIDLAESIGRKDMVKRLEELRDARVKFLLSDG